MRAWCPHPNSKLVFEFAPLRGPYHPGICPPGALTVAQWDETKSALYGTIGLDVKDSYRNESIRLSDSRTHKLIELIQSTRDHPQFRLQAAWIEEPAVLAPPATQLWYELSTGPTGLKSFQRRPGNAHFIWKEESAGAFSTLASREFRQVVMDAGLTGLRWLPITDAAGEWWEVFAELPLGRGLDHPMLDSASADESWMRKHGSIHHRRGIELAWLLELRSGVKVDDPLVNALIQMSPPHFRLQGPKRFVSEYMPPCDFAFSSWSSGQDTGPGTAGRRFRTISCNQRARDVLVGAGVMKPGRLEPMMIVPGSQAGTVILDEAVQWPLPLPLYTVNEMANELLRRTPTSHLGSRRPQPQFTSTREAADYLERRLADGTASWVAAGSGEKFGAIASAPLFLQSPESWQQLARLLPQTMEFVNDNSRGSFEFDMAIPEWNTWLDAETERDPEDAPGADDLVIATTQYGNWYSVRRSDPLMPLDGRVTYWDHETLSVSDEWPTVAAFAAHLVSFCDAARNVS
ncbi:MAG TPA: hypothetical protein VHN77_13945 [Phycisphaerales bacterium]|nr:hypothetical protein [Phycisphaerales bacterium]